MIRYFGTVVRWFFSVAFLFFFNKTIAQQDSIPPIDKSGMDVSYCPPFYPIHKAQDKIMEPLVARVFYSRPAKNNRQIFGKLVEYDKIWRLGANEATEIELFKDIRIQNVKLRKGRYSFLPFRVRMSVHLSSIKKRIPGALFLYNDKKDVFSITLPVVQLNNPIENFTIYFTLIGSNAKMNFMWDNYSFTLPFTVIKLN